MSIKKNDHVILYRTYEAATSGLGYTVTKVEVIDETVVTCVRKSGHSSGGTDYKVYLKNGDVFNVTDWNWSMRTYKSGNEIMGYVGSKEELLSDFEYSNRVSIIEKRLKKLLDKVDEVSDDELSEVERLLDKLNIK